MTVGPLIRLWEPDSALRAFHAEAVGATGGKKMGGMLIKKGAAPLGAPFELVIEYFLRILCPLLAVLEIWRHAMLFLTVNVSFLYLLPSVEENLENKKDIVEFLLQKAADMNSTDYTMNWVLYWNVHKGSYNTIWSFGPCWTGFMIRNKLSLQIQCFMVPLPHISSLKLSIFVILLWSRVIQTIRVKGWLIPWYLGWFFLHNYLLKF